MDMFSQFMEGLGLGFWYLKPFSKIFQLYHGGQFYLWRKLEYRPAASHRQTLLHNVVSSTPHLIRTHNISGVIDTDCKGSGMSNYHTTTTTTAPQFMEGTNTTKTIFYITEKIKPLTGNVKAYVQ